ncbi:MAG: response regulator, partial [Bacteroidia bacterium]|nr:response regulator [Bacteroidia bacterium]
FHCLVHHNQLVLGDSFRLKQILYNLLSNAVKFTESGMVSLWVKTLWEEGKNITVSFEIKDTGIGMTNEEIGRVFNHFEQANARVQKKYGGSGLGLSIVKELVELQNGLLSVDSEIGKGSCFTVHLTYEVADEVRQKATYPIAVSKEDFYKCVLVIDDDVCVRELCSVIFQRHHINHTFAYSLPDILKKADEYLIDLVLIDMRMPEINGVEVLRCLKNKMNSHVKFIAMTAYAFPDERASILFAGFDGILVKPFVETDLLKHVTKSHITPTITQLSTKHESPGGLANIIGDDKELYDKTFEIFSEQILIDLEELECALKKNDLDGISFSCHRLYSKLAQMGLNVPAKEILFAESCIKKNKICKLTISEYYGLKDSVVSALDKMKAFDLI